MDLPIKRANYSSLSRGQNLRPNQQNALNFVMLAVIPVLQKSYPTLIVSSAYRSTAKQAVLYAAFKAGRGPRAARPGLSFHECRKHEGGTTWALDLKLPGVAPKDWVFGLTRALNQAGVKFHTAATERGWIHLQGVYGGGSVHNPGGTEVW